MSASSLSPFSVEDVRPLLRLQSMSSELQAQVEGMRIPTRPWATVLTFLLSDLVGLLSVFGMVALIVGWWAPSLSLQVYRSLPVVLLGVGTAFAVSGLYRRQFSHPALEMQRIGILTATLAGTAGLVLFLTTGRPLVAALVVGGGLAAAIVLPLCRALFRILFARADWWGVPAVVIGEGGSGATLLDTLARWPEIGVRPVALLSDRPGAHAPAPVAVQAGHELVPYLAREFGIPYAIVAVPGLSHADRAKLLAQYSKFFDHVFVVADSAGAPALWTTGRSGEGLFGYGIRHVGRRRGARYTKRAMDLVLAGLLSVLLLPVMLVLALLIRIDSSGAVFYRQERMGRDGRIFTVWKFRTMCTDAQARLARILADDPDAAREYECYHKLQDDPRITRMGAFLRCYSLDELPQLLNVLRGDMSLVGPRAYMPSELGKMNGLAQAVLQSAPGLTGLWQVSGRNHLSFATRVNLDVHYTQNWSPWLDLYLLVRTLPVVLSGDGAS